MLVGHHDTDKSQYRPVFWEGAAHMLPSSLVFLTSRRGVGWPLMCENDCYSVSVDIIFSSMVFQNPRTHYSNNNKPAPVEKKYPLVKETHW